MNDFNMFDDEFNKLKHIERTESARKNSYSAIQERGRKKKFHAVPMIVSVAIIVVATLYLTLTFNESAPKLGSEFQIVDEQTPSVIPIVEVTQGVLLVD